MIEVSVLSVIALGFSCFALGFVLATSFMLWLRDNHDSKKSSSMIPVESCR
jgi:hypothetical protein